MRWDETAQATAHGQIVYFAEFLATAGIFESWVQSYLLRLRKTINVKRLIERLFNRQDWTQASEASQGWQAIEDQLRLSGWSKERRVVVLRRRIKRDVALTRSRGDKGQQVLTLGFDETQDDAQLWEYTVLVTAVAGSGGTSGAHGWTSAGLSHADAR